MDKWKKDYNGNEDLFIIAADVQSMYPSVKKEIVQDGLEAALKLCRNFNQNVRKSLTELTMFCLQNVVVQNQEKFAPPITKRQDMHDKKVWTTFPPNY